MVSTDQRATHFHGVAYFDVYFTSSVVIFGTDVCTLSN
jgi:hypothetical protein